MSLQVCHCGWSKVTTYHGLRIHQGKMGCTLTSGRVAEKAATQQQYTWSTVGLRSSQEPPVLDDYSCFKTGREDYYSDKSLQVCHCGWSKMTTYQGLRIHQGKMGCTPKGVRIPEREQYAWRHMWEKEEERLQPIKRSIKQVPQLPTPKDFGATIKEEYNTSVALSHYSSQRDRRPKENRSDREHRTPPNPEAVAPPKEEKVKHYSIAKKAGGEGIIRTCYNTDYGIAAKIKVEPKSPPVMPPYLSQRATTSGENHQLQDFYPDVQVTQLVREAPAPGPAVSHKVKVWKDRMLLQNSSVSSRDILERVATLREQPGQSFPNPNGSFPRLPGSESGRLVKQRESRAAAADKQVATLTQNILLMPVTTTNSTRPAQGNLYVLRLEVDLVFSEMMEVIKEAQHKSHNLPLCSLRTATLAVMEQMEQKLDKLSSLELKWISKFSVDIKLDPTTSHRCLVSADGLSVMDGGQKRKACDPPGSSGVLGLDRLSTDRSYWEVEVSSETGWDVGVARSNARSKERPENCFWVLAHENEEYVAVAAHVSLLPLKEKPQKVGVFVNYKEGRVSFYNVTAQTHIHSFTKCGFTGEIFPYFSVHPKEDGSAADPLTISPVKH